MAVCLRGMGPAEDRKLDQKGQNFEHTVNCIHDQKQTNSTATESSGQLLFAPDALSTRNQQDTPIVKI